MLPECRPTWRCLLSVKALGQYGSSHPALLRFEEQCQAVFDRACEAAFSTDAVALKRSLAHCAPATIQSSAEAYQACHCRFPNPAWPTSSPVPLSPRDSGAAAGALTLDPTLALTIRARSICLCLLRNLGYCDAEGRVVKRIPGLIGSPTYAHFSGAGPGRGRHKGVALACGPSRTHDPSLRTRPGPSEDMANIMASLQNFRRSRSGSSAPSQLLYARRYLCTATAGSGKHVRSSHPLKPICSQRTRL